MIIPVRHFGGLVTNPQQEDIPDFSSAFNLNVDPEAQGQLRGIPTNGDAYTVARVIDEISTATPMVVRTTAVHGLTTGMTVTISGVISTLSPDPNGTHTVTVVDTTHFSYGDEYNTGAYTSGGVMTVDILDIHDSAMIKYNDSGATKWDLVGIDKEDNDIVVIENFHGLTPATRTYNDLVTSPTGTASTVKIFGNAAQVGLGNGQTEIPYVVYRLLNDRKFFNDNETASAGLHAHYARCDNQATTTLVSGGTKANPCVITTSENHKMLGGELVDMTGMTVAGLASADGVFTVTVLTDTTFSLDGCNTTGDSGYTSGGTVNGQYVSCTVGTNASTGAADYFAADTLYAWAVSIVYDGLQNSNLQTVNGDTGLIVKISKANAFPSANVILNMQEAKTKFANPLYDKRMTAIKIWRAECPTGSIKVGELGLYRLVRTIDINKGYGGVNWSPSSNDYLLTYLDEGGYPEGGQTYEAETGISETRERTYIHYDLNATGGGYHWMALPYVPQSSTGGVPTAVDWDRYIFRSQKFRPNMVNWVSGNHIVLPEIPVDMIYYDDRLYVFTENKVYRINPELLIIENFYEGAGVSARGGVVPTEGGLFFCNLNGAYRLRANQFEIKVETLTDNIKIDLGDFTFNWGRFATRSLDVINKDIHRIIATYLPDKRSVVFMGQDTTATTYAYIYYLPTQEWFTWDFGDITLDSNSGIVTGKDGELYFSGDGGGASSMVKLLGGAGRQNASWISKEFTLNEPSQNKHWQKLKWGSSGTVAVKYATNGDNPFSGSTATSDTYFNTYKKTFQFYVALTSTATMDSLDVVVRKLLGDR